jgi:hypothetical protein
MTSAGTQAGRSETVDQDHDDPSRLTETERIALRTERREATRQHIGKADPVVIRPR